MSVLMWDKPKKVMSEEQRRRLGSSDAEIHGTYLPNMSASDVKKWKAKLTGTRSGHPQVEIRKDTSVFIISLKDGYKYKGYTPENTKGKNIHIATAGAIQWSFAELEEFFKAAEEAREALRKLDSQ